MRRPLLAIVVVFAALPVAACSSSSASMPTVTICDPGHGAPQAAGDLPEVSKIATAIADLEAKLGGPQEYFEVNATARLVNLFVALNNATVAQSWTWVDGALTAQEGKGAQGGTFKAGDLHIDAAHIFDDTRRQVPQAIIETFYVNGDGKGAVEYGLLSSARCGGGLDVTVGPDGKVKTVMPVG